MFLVFELFNYLIFMLLQPIDIAIIQNVKINDVTFPLIQYENSPDLKLNSTTLIAAYSLICTIVPDIILQGLEWGNGGNINWHNEKLKEIVEIINDMIIQY